MYFAALLDEDGKGQKYHYLDNIPFLADHEKKHLTCTQSIEDVDLEVTSLDESRKDCGVAYFSLCFFRQYETS